MNKSMSDTQIDSMADFEKTPPNYNITTRTKRRRESSPNSKDFKDEIRQLLAEFKMAQKHEFEKVFSNLKDIRQSNLEIANSISFLMAQHDEFKKKIEKLENKVQENNNYILTLEEKIEHLQRDALKGKFEIKNVPKQKNESKEDLIKMVLCLSNNIGNAVTQKEIKDVYRIRVKNPNETRTPIIVETDTMTKVQILRSGKAYNIKNKSKLCSKHLGINTPEDTPIYISEHLTAKASRLHFLARDLVKTKAYKYCWTAYGRVYLRRNEDSPIININSESQIQNLIQST